MEFNIYTKEAETVTKSLVIEDITPIYKQLESEYIENLIIFNGFTSDYYPENIEKMQKAVDLYRDNQPFIILVSRAQEVYPCVFKEISETEFEVQWFKINTDYSYIDSETVTITLENGVVVNTSESRNSSFEFDYQDKLVSGDNIKTINNESILGSGNINTPTKTSELTNDSGFITSIPSEYVTETELASKGYITEVPENVFYWDGQSDDVDTFNKVFECINNNKPFIITNNDGMILNSHRSTSIDFGGAPLTQYIFEGSKIETSGTTYTVTNYEAAVMWNWDSSSVSGVSEATSYTVSGKAVTKVSELTNDSKYVSSTTIAKIEKVTEYPSNPDANTLYIKVES